MLPKDAPVAAVGGVSEADFRQYLQAGMQIFSLGSSLYKPGFTAAEVRSRARNIVLAYDAARGG